MSRCGQSGKRTSTFSILTRQARQLGGKSGLCDMDACQNQCDSVVTHTV